MTPQQEMEQFSKAYISALASYIGANVLDPQQDQNSVDLTLCYDKSTGEKLIYPKIDVQLKCHGVDNFSENIFPLSFSLKKKNYNELCIQKLSVPIILVVLLVPKENTNWITLTEKELVLKYNAYWTCIQGEEKTNQTSKTVYLEKNKRVTPDCLKTLFQKISEDGKL